MSLSTWRAGEILLPNGVIAVNVCGSGRATRQTVTFQNQHTRREVATLSDLASILHTSGASAESLASADPVGFASLVCLLSGRPHHVFPRDSMWPELERHFSLDREENEPHVADGKFQFVTYSQYMPVLEISRIIVDLATLEVDEQPLVRAAWPPVASPVQPVVTG